MYNYNNEYSQQEFENNYEFNTEFESDLEMENFEGETGFNNESESNYEMDPEFQMEGDHEYENDFESGSQFESNEYENEQDEMETELEYVTNEQELSNWVSEVVVRTNPGLRPVLRSPLGRRAVRQFSKIAFKTLPYIGRKRSGWKRPYQYRRPYYNRYGRPGYRWWRNRPTWGNVPGTAPQPFQNINTPQQPQSFTDGQQQPPIQQDGSFKNFVLDTIKNLSEQIARGNESIAALKNSMTNSAVNNFPAIVQPKTDNPDQPAPNSPTPPPADTTPNQPVTPGEKEWENYEYANEYNNEANYEYNNEANYEYNGETDGEIPNGESSFNEVTEMELASELLSVNNEMELERFLNNLLRKGAGNFSNLPESPQGEIFKKIFKKIIKKAIPIVAGVVAGPAGAIAADAIVAQEVFNLELEGLSNEDSEFEVAKAFVRFAGNAAKDASDNETGDPVKDAEFSMIRAARRFAPGLLRRRRRNRGRGFRYRPYRGRGYGYRQSPDQDYPPDQNDDDNNMGQ